MKGKISDTKKINNVTQKQRELEAEMVEEKRKEKKERENPEKVINRKETGEKEFRKRSRAVKSSYWLVSLEKLAR